MNNALFCHSKMKKADQIELVYGDFIDMRSPVSFLYKPNNVVIYFDKKGYFLGTYSNKELLEKILFSFERCRYTFDDSVKQAKKLVARFKKSLPVLNFESLTRGLNEKIKLGISLLSNEIYACFVNKKGSQKQDVTLPALLCVVEYCLNHGYPVILEDENGKPKFEITVKDLRK